MQVIITSRLMPGLRIGKAFISIDPTERTDHHGKPIWDWYVDIAGKEYQGADLAGWDDAEGMLKSLTSFLSAAGEAYDYNPGMEADSSTNLFPEPVCIWAAASQDELSMCSYEEEVTE